MNIQNDALKQLEDLKVQHRVVDEHIQDLIRDFNNDQLNNSLTTLKNYIDKPELGMSLLFQTANVQLLPITRLESLKHFWNYSAKNNLEKLSFEISKSLIESIEPSIELSEFVSEMLSRLYAEAGEEDGVGFLRPLQDTQTG